MKERVGVVSILLLLGAIVLGFGIDAVLFVRNRLLPWMEDQP